MKTKLIAFISLLLLSTSYNFAQLIISEYLEGSGNDKCIEIYNTTASSINLSAYTIQIYSNGNTTASSTITLSGTIPSCGTHVICNSAASQAGSANQTSGSLGFNGDDAVGLFNGASLIDLFGNIGNDPGSEWTGVGGGTADDGFIRNTNYCSGVTSNPGGTGPTAFTTFNTTNWTSVGTSGATLGSHTSACGACSTATNTVVIDALSSLSYTIECSTGANGSVDITTTGVFNSANDYIVQLSDEFGSFAGPITIGSLNSTANTATINFTIPPGTVSGTAYRIRVLSTDPAVISSDNGTDISITLSGSCTPPYMTSVIINSCNPTCTEGFNEIVFGNSGDYSFDVTPANFNFTYGSNPTAGSNTNYTDVLVNNTATLDSLNTAAGCPGLFIDATGTTIPAGANWMMAYTNICTEALTWDGLCGSGPIYVIFQDDPDWNTSGNFANNTTTIRYFQTSITTTTGDIFTIDYSIDGTQYVNSDGTFATFSSGGGPAISYQDDDCILTSTVLPVELIDFKGVEMDGQVLLSWITLSEYNFSHFILSHSASGYDFSFLSNVPSAGNSNQVIQYREIHDSPVPGVNYYNLKAQDIDGKIRNHGTIAIEINSSFAYYSPSDQSIHLSKKYVVDIYDLTGKLIISSLGNEVIPFDYKGVFFIQEKKSNVTQKIVIY